MAVCSEEYLVALILEVLRAKAFPLVKLIRAHDVEEQIQRLQFTCTEIHRLFRVPGLFPSQAVRTRFAAILASDANLHFVHAVKELLLRDTIGDIAFYSRCRTRPTYQPGSKGWENFLLNMAPGVPLKHLRVTTTPKSSYQVIPIAGMRIVGDANREEQMLASWINDTPIPLEVEPAATTKLLDLDKPDEQEPNPSLMLSQQSFDVFARPNPFKESRRVRLDLSLHGPELLEDYSPFIGRLESNPIPPNHPIATLNAPNIFPMVTLRSWHPPTKLGALQYHRTTEGDSRDPRRPLQGGA